MKRKISRNPKRARYWQGMFSAGAYLVAFAQFSHPHGQDGLMLAIITAGMWWAGHAIAIWYDDNCCNWLNLLVASARLALMAGMTVAFSVSISDGHMGPVDYGCLVFWGAVFAGAPAIVISYATLWPTRALFTWTREYESPSNPSRRCSNENFLT
jgi:hypothetical protein